MHLFRQKKLPFQNMKAKQWGNLAITSILLTYVLIFWADIKEFGLFQYAGLDYRTFYTSAQIAWQENFPQVYNLEVQSQYQKPIYETYARGTNLPPLQIVPTPYWPIFILPFVIFLPVPPDIGFYAFVVISLIVIVIYILRLINAFQIQQNNQHEIVLMIVASLPVFLNFFYGQINILMLICLGEFLINKSVKKNLIAGLWLAGWLVKPQALIFLLPLLLFTRHFRILIGFSIGAIGIFAISTLIAGEQWIPAWLSLVTQYSGNLATTNPFAMINLRSLLINLEMLTNAYVAWSITIILLSLISYWLIKTAQHSLISEKYFVFSILAVYAGTLTLTWHSHAHMAIPIFAPLLYLYTETQKKNIWALIIGVPFLGLITNFLLSYWLLQNNIVSIFMLVTNIYIIYWCYKETR